MRDCNREESLLPLALEELPDLTRAHGEHFAPPESPAAGGRGCAAPERRWRGRDEGGATTPATRRAFYRPGALAGKPNGVRDSGRVDEIGGGVRSWWDRGWSRGVPST